MINGTSQRLYIQCNSAYRPQINHAHPEGMLVSPDKRAENVQRFCLVATGKSH